MCAVSFPHSLPRVFRHGQFADLLIIVHTWQHTTRAILLPGCAVDLAKSRTHGRPFCLSPCPMLAAPRTSPILMAFASISAPSYLLASLASSHSDPGQKLMIHRTIH